MADLDIRVSNNKTYAAKLEQLRDRSLKPRAVRSLVTDMTALLAEEAIQTHSPDEKIAVIVILRAGLAMTDAFISKLPESADVVVYHLGLFREKQSLQPVEYYNKLPPKHASIKHAYILDPLLATGGTARAAISIVRDWGLEELTFVSLLGSTAGVKRACQDWPSPVKLIVGAVDEGLDSHGYVQPGVGDIGDRLFGTTF